MSKKQETPVLPLVYGVTNISVSNKHKEISFTEVLDYGLRSIDRKMKFDFLPLLELFNSMLTALSLKQTQRFLSHCIENKLDINLPMISKAKSLNCEKLIEGETAMEFYNNIENEDDKAWLIRQAQVFNERFNGNFTLRNFVVNNGEFKTGDYIMVTAPQSGTTAAKILHTEVGALVVFVMDKKTYGSLTTEATAKVISTTDLPKDLVETLDEGFAAWTERAEDARQALVDRDGRAKEREAKRAEEAAKAAKVVDGLIEKIDNCKTAKDLQELHAKQEGKKFGAHRDRYNAAKKARTAELKVEAKIEAINAETAKAKTAIGKAKDEEAKAALQATIDKNEAEVKELSDKLTAMKAAKIEARNSSEEVPTEEAQA